MHSDTPKERHPPGHAGPARPQDAERRQAVARLRDHGADPAPSSEDLLRVEEGSLYPALHRMAQAGWLKAEWGVTDKNRQARYYTITKAGRKQLALEEESWTRLWTGVQRVLETP